MHSAQSEISCIFYYFVLTPVNFDKLLTNHLKDTHHCWYAYRSLWTTRVEELIVVFNHNVINLYFTANKSSMYKSYYDKVYQLLW